MAKRIKRCVGYTRVSTNAQAKKEYSSCESQAETIASFLASKKDMRLVDVLTDAGFSGGTMDRPALIRLIEMVKRNQVDLVIVYKIDRISRDTSDFYCIMKTFEKHDVQIISTSKLFDQESASGRLLRNMMLNIGQFERETIAERTRDKMKQRAEKGLWHGGHLPLGYGVFEGKLFIANFK